MKRRKRILWTVAIGVPAAYAAWSLTGRGANTPVEARLESVSSYGVESGAGNLLGVEPYMTAGDYASSERFHAKLRLYMEAARDHGWLRPDTVVVFPEYLATWLVAMHEHGAVYRAPSTTAAMTRIVLANLPAFAAAYIGADEPNRTEGALFRMKGRAVAEAYDAAFSSLAGEYGVTVVGGSAIVPGPRIVDGRFRAGPGPLYNVVAVYGPNGRASGIVRKVFATPDERPFMTGGRIDEIRSFATPAGRLGVMVCADSWSPELYRHLKDERVDILAVPSFGGFRGVWNAPWKGYGTGTPPDVNLADEGRITEKEAWLKYAMPGRYRAAGAHAGLNVFFQGDLWEFHPEAQTLAVQGGRTHVRPVPATRGGSIVNIWL